MASNSRRRSRRDAPTAANIAIDLSDGERLDIGLVAPSGTETSVSPIGAGEVQAFDRCPICLTPNPTTNEDVPPMRMGGTVLLKTCELCNHRFGSAYEPHLINWWNDSLGEVRFGHSSVPGRRRAGRVLVRQTPVGEPAILLESGQIDPEIQERMQNGESFEIVYSPPDEARYRIAALKSAYLAACSILSSIPESPQADQVRAELLAARDLPKRAKLQLGPIASSVRVSKSPGPARRGEILLVRVPPVGNAAAEYAVSMAGTLLVSWPLGGYLVFECDGVQQVVELNSSVANTVE